MFPHITNAGQFVSPKMSVSIRSCYNFLPLKYNHLVCNNPLWKGRRRTSSKYWFQRRVQQMSNTSELNYTSPYLFLSSIEVTSTAVWVWEGESAWDASSPCSKRREVERLNEPWAAAGRMSRATQIPQPTWDWGRNSSFPLWTLVKNQCQCLQFFSVTPGFQCKQDVLLMRNGLVNLFFFSSWFNIV